MLESIYKLFSEIVTENTKYISNNHSNSFKVKISKWGVTYECVKYLKTSWIYEKYSHLSSNLKIEIYYNDIKCLKYNLLYKWC